MNVKDIIDILETVIPADMAESWDNVGLLVGNENATVNKVLIALDPVTSVINEALLLNADLIITHHPIMFSPINKVTPKTYDGKIISTLLENKINLCAMHTNLDYYRKGLNYMAAKALNLVSVQPLVPHEKYENAGMGVIGYLPFAVPISLDSLAEYVKSAFKADFVKFAGAAEADMHKIAIVTGSGTDYIDAAIAQQADVLITGDIKYHTAVDAVERGLYLIDAGHFDTEKNAINLFYKLLYDKLKENNVEIIKSRQKNIFNIK